MDKNMIKKIILFTIPALIISISITILNPQKEPEKLPIKNHIKREVIEDTDDDEDSIHVRNVFLMNIKHIIKFFRI